MRVWHFRLLFEGVSNSGRRLYLWVPSRELGKGLLSVSSILWPPFKLCEIHRQNLLLGFDFDYLLSLFSDLRQHDASMMLIEAINSVVEAYHSQPRCDTRLASAFLIFRVMISRSPLSVFTMIMWRRVVRLQVSVLRECEHERNCFGKCAAFRFCKEPESVCLTFWSSSLTSHCKGLEIQA